MPANPKKLNALQLKTLAILQAVAADRNLASPPDEAGQVTINGLPHIHGDHFHIGKAVVRAKDATGLGNQNVFNALVRKGLLVGGAGGRPVLTVEALTYDTGAAGSVIHGADH
jgi:hypothetical protein